MSKTVRARIPVLINTEAKWAAYGWTDAGQGDCDSVLHDMMGMEEQPWFSLTVEVELPIPSLPEPQTVEGEVVSDD